VHPVQAVVPAVLAEIIRRQPSSPARTSFAWSVAVGPALSRVTTVELRDRVLRVYSRDARWGREISRARSTILERIRLLLGHDAVSDVVLVD
jgi:hypothetical protein